MDIEQNNPSRNVGQSGENRLSEKRGNNDGQRLSFQNQQGHNNRNSFQGRMSNESYMSFGRMSLQDPAFYENQKISLQSNISSKARQIEQKRDLFQNLANEGRNSFNQELFLREESSLKPTQFGQQIYQNNTIHQVHYPIFLGLQHSNNFLNPYNPNLCQQFKQRSSQGTTNVTPSVFNQNQSQSTIRLKNFDNQFNINPLNESSLAQEEIKKEPQEKVISCKCPRSKCLLMYCECFSKGIMCNPSCSCYQCRNNPDFEEKRQNARRIVLQRDPNAFSNKLQVVGGQQYPELAYKRGCNCKKTNCFKKYCECFYAGVKCTYLCKCENCMNGGQNAYKG